MRIKHLLLLTIFILSTAKLTVSAEVYQEDSLNILAIRVEFQEDDATTTTGNGKFNLSEPTHQFQIDPPPHNRSYFSDHLLFLTNYFRKISQGRLVISGDVFPLDENEAYQLDGEMSRYNPNRTPEENNIALAELFRDAFQTADQDSDINFSEYNGFIIFHAGVGKDIDLGFDETPQDIPSFFITSEFLQTYLGVPGIPVDDGTVTVSGAVLAPETESQEGLELGLNGILASNIGSMLGWLDLFSPETQTSGIGRFGLMDVGLFNGDGLLPAIPCAWTRLEAGWESVIDVDYSSGDVFEVSAPLVSHPDKIYRFPINRNEYFLIENRYAGELSFDSLQFELSRNRPEFATAREVLETYYSDQVLFSSRGVLTDVSNPDIGLPGSGSLIWHVDERVIDQNRASNRINADPEHRGVDLEEADGSQDIGQTYDFLSPGYGSEIGYLLDMWYQGNSAPLFKNRFSPESVPASLSYYNRANSHITISDFSSADSVMTFRASFSFFQQNFPLSIDPDLVGHINFMKSSDTDYDGRDDIILITDSGKILLMNDDNAGPDIDSILVADIGSQVLGNPVLFDHHFYSGRDRTKTLLLSDQNNRIWGFVFNTGGNLDTLFSPILLNSRPTTHPVAFYEPPDSSINVLWGMENGSVFKLLISQDGIDSSSQRIAGAAIEYLHVNGNRETVAVVRNGEKADVYVDGMYFRSSSMPIFSPAGNFSASVSSEGKFLLLGAQQDGSAEDGLFNFSSPLIINPFGTKEQEHPGYIIGGNNRVFLYNYNFTLQDNFPVMLSEPDQSREIPFSPLVNRFFVKGGSENYGMIVADAVGVMDGFDMYGERLEDFPVTAGRSLAVSPVILDLDGDGDLELAAVTEENILYVWDFGSSYDPLGWNQLYGNEMNSNLNPNESSTGTGTTPALAQGDPLMPEKMVYNWPNPNQDDFTFIRYFLTEQATVNIKIFDMAGDLVDEFPGSGDPNTANEVRWNLKDVQSGVYLARVEAESAGKKEVRIIKVAVVK